MLDADTHTVFAGTSLNVPNVILMALLPCPLFIVPTGTLQLNVTPACVGHV